MKTKLLIVLSLFALKSSYAKTLTLVDPIAPNIADLIYCDSNNDGFGEFDLTQQNSLILEAQSGTASDYAITYHETLTDANTGSSPLLSPYFNINSFNQTIYYRIRNVGTNTYAVGSFQLAVNASPIAVSLSPIAVCDADSNPQNGVTSINLTQQTATILALQPIAASNYTVSFYASQVQAFAGISSIIPASSYVGSNGETIWYRVQTNSTGCYAVGSFNLIINSPPLASSPPFYLSCDNYGSPSDGIGALDLTIFEYQILDGQNPSNHQITYFTTQADAINGSNPISLSLAQAFITPTADVWVKVSNSSGCYALTTINIFIESNPNPIITSTNNRTAICVDYITNAVVQPLLLDSGIVNPSSYSFEWYEISELTTVIATSSMYYITTPSANGATRGYVVKVTNNNALGCQMTSSSFDVIQSSQAVIPSGTDGYSITNLSGVQSINVAISGYGTYEYSLDNGPSQVSNVFDNVSLGTHAVTVWDTEGGINYSCDPLIINNIEIAVSQVPAPTGLNSQTFNPGATLANIVVSGTNIQWYASAANKNSVSMLATPLPESTVLVNGTIYYATQTVGGIESTAYLPVTVNLALGVGDNDILRMKYSPNPVKNSLTLQSATILKSIMVYTMLGQKVFEQNCNDTDITIELSKLTIGNYILKAQGETSQKTIRIVKE